MTMAQQNNSVTTSLDDLSREKLPTVLPTVIFVGIAIAIGLIGNIFVLIVFGCKMKTQSTYRYFILVLAAYDLTACSIGMPGLIYGMVEAYKFYSGIGCKFLRYGFHVIAGGSSLTHALVGIDRYRRICRPTNTQMSVQRAKLVTFITLIFCLICALPVFIMTDSVTVDTRVANITGHACDILPTYSRTALPIIFNCLLSTYLLVTVILLIVLYSLIGYTLCRRKNAIRPTNNQASSRHMQTSISERHHKRKHKGGPSIEISIQDSVSHFPATMSTHRADSYKETVVPAFVRKLQTRENVSRKMTVITFIITIVFIISFAPIQVLALITLLDDDIMRELSYTQEVLYRFGNHTYVLNNIANPLVYIFMDVEFRKNCAKLLRLLKCKVNCKR